MNKNKQLLFIALKKLCFISLNNFLFGIEWIVVNQPGLFTELRKTLIAIMFDLQLRAVFIFKIYFSHDKGFRC